MGFYEIRIINPGHRNELAVGCKNFQPFLFDGSFRRANKPEEGGQGHGLTSKKAGDGFWIGLEGRPVRFDKVKGNEIRRFQLTIIFENCEGDGLMFFVFTPADAANRIDDSATTEPAAEIPGEGADIGTGGAMNTEMKNGRLIAQEFNGIERDFFGGRFGDGFPAANPVIQGFSFILFGRDQRRDLFDFADKCIEDPAEFGVIQIIGDRVLGRDDTHPVMRIRFHPEAERGLIDFIVIDEEGGQTGGDTKGKGKDTVGHRVKGPEVTDLAKLQDAAHPIDHIMGSDAGGFKDKEEAVMGRDGFGFFPGRDGFGTGSGHDIPPSAEPSTFDRALPEAR